MGSVRAPSATRPIILKNCSLKIVTTCTTGPVSEGMAVGIRGEQKGFVPKRNFIDHIVELDAAARVLSRTAPRDNENFKFTNPRALISDLDTVPYPSYDLLELDIYFRYSSIPYSVEAYNARRRLSTVWERGCPRGCTFCSHNGMSRIDLQNIYGDGDRRSGEKLA